MRECECLSLCTYVAVYAFGFFGSCRVLLPAVVVPFCLVCGWVEVGGWVMVCMLGYRVGGVFTLYYVLARLPPSASVVLDRENSRDGGRYLHLDDCWSLGQPFCNVDGYMYGFTWYSEMRAKYNPLPEADTAVWISSVKPSTAGILSGEAGAKDGPQLAIYKTIAAQPSWLSYLSNAPLFSISGLTTRVLCPFVQTSSPLAGAFLRT
jgi:hypothetical protein